MTDIDISLFLEIVAEEMKEKKVPVVDLIAVQSREPFKVLVATILSARTKDEVTAKAAARLFAKAQTAEELRQLSEEEIAQAIFPVGFYKTKAKHLRKLPAAMDAFSGKVPQTMAELLTLPGVGRKTANLVLSTAFNLPAICVDTHVHRIMNIWGYVATDSPQKTEKALREKLPKKHWIAVNSLLVRLGQSICRPHPIGVQCGICPLDDKCPKIGVIPRKEKVSKKQAQNTLRFISWNVNGIRALEKKGFVEIMQNFDADIVALQETKAQKEQLSENLTDIPGYTSYWHSALRKGYSGVAVYSRIEPLSVQYGLKVEEFDCEGRLITLEFSSFYFITGYFPNAGRDLKRLEYKLRFNAALLEHCRQLEKRKTVVLCGDFNVAHKEIDLKNPKNNENNAGFTQEERKWFSGFLSAGYIDTFRLFNKSPEQYSWWSYRFGAREKNIGWRIDYFCVNDKARERIADASILQEVMGSDHCPVCLEFAAG